MMMSGGRRNKARSAIDCHAGFGKPERYRFQDFAVPKNRERSGHLTLRMTQALMSQSIRVISMNVAKSWFVNHSSHPKSRALWSTEFGGEACIISSGGEKPKSVFAGETRATWPRGTGCGRQKEGSSETRGGPKETSRSLPHCTQKLWPVQSRPGIYPLRHLIVISYK